MSQKFTVAVTILNVVLLAFLLTGAASTPPAGDVLRGRALEIVDEEGRVRASIKLHAAGSANGEPYPETVVFRLIDPNGRPGVKAGASVEGGGLGVVGRSDETRVQLLTDDDSARVKVTSADRERSLTP